MVTSGGRAEGHAVASTAERRRTNATSGNKVQRITVLSREAKFDATPGRDASQDAARHLLPLTFCPGAASAVLGFMQLGAPATLAPDEQRKAALTFEAAIAYALQEPPG